MEISKNSSSFKKSDKLGNLDNNQKIDVPQYNDEKKKKQKVDISKDVILNFKYDDYEPVDQKYKPLYRKNTTRNYYSYDQVDILDQNRFKFILNLEIDEQSYNKYLYTSSSNIKWEDVYIVKCFLENLHTCAICLEKEMVCPQITRCGHIFCWPCIDNYYDYWTIAAINKKQPKCPLCKELIIPEELKICEIIQCVNYLDSVTSDNYNEINTDIITFNLLMKEKKGQVIYNINADPDLSYFKENYLKNESDSSLTKICNNVTASKSSNKFKSSFNFIPIEKSEEFSYSRIFETKYDLISNRLNQMRKDLEENLKEELNSEQDERRINSLTKCLEIVKSDIQFYENLVPKNDEPQQKKNETLNSKKNNENKKIQLDLNNAYKYDISSLKNNMEKEISSDTENKQNTIYNSNQNEDKVITVTGNVLIENLSTVDEDSSQNNNRLNYLRIFEADIEIDLKNYFFFYQESKGDIYLLHPINYQILLKEYKLEDHLPTQISGKILEIESHQVTEHLKNKYQFLNHMRLGSIFYFVEIDMKNLVSNYTLKYFQNVLKDRSKVRNSIRREEENYENYVQTIKTSEEINFNQQFRKMSDFKEKLKSQEYFKENSDNESSSSLNRKDSNNNNEVDGNQINIANLVQKSTLKSLFTGEFDEEKKKKEQEMLNEKNNKKKFVIEDLPSLDDPSLGKTEIKKDTINLDNEIDSNNDNKLIQTNQLPHQIGDKYHVMTNNKKGKKNNCKKKFVNIEVNFGAKLTYDENKNYIENEENMLDEDIIYKNLANKKPKQLKNDVLNSNIMIKKGKK